MEKTGFFNNSRQVLKTIEGQTLEGLGDIDITKADVDLSNVDNTSDADKPVSTAQQTALDLKIDKVSSPTNNDVAKINSDGEIENSGIQLSNIELNTNKATSFQNTPNDNKYPSEKLVKDSLDSKENSSNKVASFQNTPNDNKYPSEKLVKDNLDLKSNIDDIKDNLTSNNVDKPLSANQGKVLQNGKANKITGGTDGNITTRDANGDIQDSGNSIADVKNRTNHTGTQAISTVSGLQTELDAKAARDTDAVTNNVVIFDSNGNPVDGGTNLADLNDGWDGEVNTFAVLPSASSNNGKKYIVKTPTGTIILGTKKYAGTYISDGTNWNIFGYKQSSVINQLLTGFTAHASVVAISSTDSILAGFQKSQKYFNDYLSNFNGANQLTKLDSSGKVPSLIYNEIEASNKINLNDNQINLRGTTNNNNNDHYIKFVEFTVGGANGVEIRGHSGVKIVNQLEVTDKINLNDNKINFRGTTNNNDNNHYIKFNSSNDGIQIKSNDTTLISDFCKFEGNKSLTKNFGYFNSSANTGTATNYTGNYSAEFSQRILADEFNATSDARIKNIISISDGKKDLEILEKIEICDFTYKDKIAKGSRIRKKVIAQQVEKVFPQSVSEVESVIPSVFKEYEVAENKIFIDTASFNLKVNSKLQVITENENETQNHKITIKEVKSNFIVVDKSFEKKRIFVYGEFVKDFKVVDYEEIAMLAVSVIQEQSKTIERISRDLEKLSQNIKKLKP